MRATCCSLGTGGGACGASVLPVASQATPPPVGHSPGGRDASGPRAPRPPDRGLRGSSAAACGIGGSGGREAVAGVKRLSGCG